MENPLRIEECLRHADKQGLYSIGADIVINPPTREYVLGGIHVLRDNLIKLRTSDAPHDTQAIKDINRYFKKSDYSHASANLNENLDIPLGCNIVEWLSEGTDHDIEQFCLWSLRRTLQLTEAINRDKPRLADHAHNKTNKLERIGLFPSTATALMQKATDEYTLAGMDSFFSGGRRVVGFCVEDEIVFSNQYRLRRPMRLMSTTMKRYMFHEYLHGAAKDRGFLYGIKQPFYYNHIMDEAFVEHATTVAHTPVSPRHQVIHPNKRLPFGDLNVYVPERTFLATLNTYADVAIEHVSEIYFSERGDERGERLREDLERKIGKFFGNIHAFFVFADMYQNATQPQKDNLVYETVSYLSKTAYTSLAQDKL